MSTIPTRPPAQAVANGTATITWRNQGINIIIAIYALPTTDKKVHHEEYPASLSLILPHLPE